MIYFGGSDLSQGVLGKSPGFLGGWIWIWDIPCISQITGRSYLHVEESHHASLARAGVVKVDVLERGHRRVQIRVCRLRGL